MVALLPDETIFLLSEPWSPIHLDTSDLAAEIRVAVAAEREKRAQQQWATAVEKEKARIGYIRMGVSREGLDYWTNWAIFSPHFTDDEVLDRLGWCGFSGGPGRAFGDGPMIRRTKTRVLVTQRCGLDI